jgi:hypothetical protein
MIWSGVQDTHGRLETNLLRELEYHNRNETDRLRFQYASALDLRQRRPTALSGRWKSRGQSASTRVKNRPSSDRETLWDAFQRTTYIARTSGGDIHIHPGRQTPELDALLSQDADQWAYVTAYNPNSQLLPIAENVARQQTLVKAVQDRGLTFFEGASVLDAAAWPPEPSLLILGIAPGDARSLGRRFGQLAIVVGRVGEPAQVIPCEDQGPTTKDQGPTTRARPRARG